MPNLVKKIGNTGVNFKTLGLFSFGAILIIFWPFFGFCVKNQKMAKIWSKWPQMKKIRSLLHFELKKLEKWKLSYFFNSGPFWQNFGHFLIFGPKTRIWPKMVKMAPNEKNKTTFISSTLKVEEIKVGLFFRFEPFFYQFCP